MAYSIKIHKSLIGLFVLIFALTLHGTEISSNKTLITGKVVEAISGDPLIGANVTIKNTNYGSSTDENGNF
ncbi:MAG: carboxypeptidase-like regulatory domain-containing protein [Melioribacteraceae bacterium]|nr:carboxypeptidase-like regulatory domain-containing protein [Melioribacteraceae bacterium]